MRQKLQIDREVASPEDFLNARRSMPGWFSRPKLDALEGLFYLQDAGRSRRKYAAEFHISPRTLQRWIHDFNSGGVAGVMDQLPRRPGRKRKIGVMEFRDRILPAAREALMESGQPDTIKNLYQSARTLGLTDVSYATFRRQVQAVSDKYRRRRIRPTLDEWMYHGKTGCWPRHLKAFGRRQTKREKEAFARWREAPEDDCQAMTDDGTDYFGTSALENNL